MLVRAGSISRQATSPSAKPPVERIRVVERHDGRGLGDRHLRAHRTGAGHDPVAVEHGQGLVDRAVVAPVHDRDPRAGRSGGAANRSTKRLASVADIASCHEGSPNRRASSSATQAASGEGSMVVMPRLARSASASVTWGSACPVIAPVSPRQRSTYSFPSTSVSRAPGRVLDEHREPARPAGHPGHRYAGEQVAAGLDGQVGGARVAVRRNAVPPAAAARPAGHGRS